MSFEEFEQILLACGEAKPCDGASDFGSEDWEVKLWRCYRNNNCCQVHLLYKAISKTIEAEKAKARLEGGEGRFVGISMGRKRKMFRKRRIEKKIDLLLQRQSMMMKIILCTQLEYDEVKKLEKEWNELWHKIMEERK